MLAAVGMPKIIPKTENGWLEGWEQVSVCPWQWQPFRLVRLTDMLRFYAGRFLELVEFLKDMSVFFELHPNLTHLTTEQVNFLQKKIELLRSHLCQLNLPVSIKFTERLMAACKTDIDISFTRDLFRHISLTICDEMESALFSQVPHHLSSFYQSTKPLFGENVHRNFPSAIIDIEEAGNSLALGRNTACVFHLMRVLEVGLRALGKSLNDPSLDPKKNPTWESILRRCDAELQKPYAQRSPEWQANPQFFSEATANLRAVKDAWRNPTLHIDLSYDEERARDVWNVVGAFLRHLATHLSE